MTMSSSNALQPGSPTLGADPAADGSRVLMCATGAVHPADGRRDATELSDFLKKAARGTSRQYGSTRLHKDRGWCFFEFCVALDYDQLANWANPKIREFLEGEQPLDV